MIRNEMINEVANFVEILFTERAPFYSNEQYKLNVSKIYAESTDYGCYKKDYPEISMY